MTPNQKRERVIQYEILAAWGAHPRLRLARINTGAGFYNDDGPCRRTDPGARPIYFNPKGTGDIVGLIAPSGRMVQIEAKAEGGTQSPEQIVMERVVTAFGGLYVLAYSLEDVDKAFAAIGITR
jgi:hypothetical protein